MTKKININRPVQMVERLENKFILKDTVNPHLRYIIDIPENDKVIKYSDIAHFNLIGELVNKKVKKYSSLNYWDYTCYEVKNAIPTAYNVYIDITYYIVEMFN